MVEGILIYEELERYLTNLIGIQFNRLFEEECLEAIASYCYLELNKFDNKVRVEVLDINNENKCLVIYSMNNKKEYISVLIVFNLLCKQLVLVLSHTKAKPNNTYVKRIMEKEYANPATPEYYRNNNPYSIDTLNEDGLVFREYITKNSGGIKTQSIINLLKEFLNMFYTLLRK